MNTYIWLTISATLLGPILAVQAQKFVELSRERRFRKVRVFETLMATRAARLSADHVQALNMIDLVFYGGRVLGISRRRKSEQAVLDAWLEYRDHLGNEFDENTFSVWDAKGDELFVNLLLAISLDVRFVFDRVQLKKGIYYPRGHGTVENENNTIRRGLLQLLSGVNPLKMEVTSLPIHEEALKAQLELQAAWRGALEGASSLKVTVNDYRRE